MTRVDGPWIPEGIFLDTSIVAYLDRYGDEIWESVQLDPNLPEQLLRQIEALGVLMALTERAGLAFAVSPEVARQARCRYVFDIADHWEVARIDWGIEERGLPPVTLIVSLPLKDQVVLAEAYRSGCEVVLTNDLKWTRRKHGRTIAALGMSAHTPESLVNALRPWLPLWL
jgi:hypothetical protein